MSPRKTKIHLGELEPGDILTLGDEIILVIAKEKRFPRDNSWYDFEFLYSDNYMNYYLYHSSDRITDFGYDFHQTSMG